MGGGEENLLGRRHLLSPTPVPLRAPRTRTASVSFRPCPWPLLCSSPSLGHICWEGAPAPWDHAEQPSYAIRVLFNVWKL